MDSLRQQIKLVKPRRVCNRQIVSNPPLASEPEICPGAGCPVLAQLGRGFVRQCPGAHENCFANRLRDQKTQVVEMPLLRISEQRKILGLLWRVEQTNYYPYFGMLMDGTNKKNGPSGIHSNPQRSQRQPMTVIGTLAIRDLPEIPFGALCVSYPRIIPRSSCPTRSI